MCSRSLLLTLVALIEFALVTSAAPPDRIRGPVDTRNTRQIAGHLHTLAQARYDRGAAGPDLRLDDMVLAIKPSAAQQAELDQLLAGQQNPGSPQFHKWLTPEEFGSRFGLSASDHSRIVAWLTSEGFTVRESARARNWIAFGGTAAQVARSLHAPIHRLRVNGNDHFANLTRPSVPDALADVIEDIFGLDDFLPTLSAHLADPGYNSGNSHYLVPEDYGTIYNIAPLYQAGIDGTGQGIVVIGQSNILLSDIRAFRTRYNLPANDPKITFYGGTDPGFSSSAQVEANLDIEWAGAVAPKATIYYIYGASAFTAMLNAINLNLAPVISSSFGSCELNASPQGYRAYAQQANAQGITIVSASGDSGAAGCDSQGSELVAARGQALLFPSVMPEVTAVGGTQFVEGSGTYWASSNSPNLGSALSYIPEAAWNESGPSGLLSTGGGASLLYSRPAWQQGPTVPAGSARLTPDVSLSAAGHDAYMINYLGSNVAVSGTSASTPSFAGILALLNGYQVAHGFQKQPGLGNINPQLYRLAQAVPGAFHDVSAGDNIVPCALGSPDCLTGSFGYRSGLGYDMATGLGSIEANTFVTMWNTPANGVSVKLSAGAPRVTLNDTVNVTASVAPLTGSATPTGSIEFSANAIPLGTVPLAGPSASLSFPAYLLSTGTSLVTASYSGDAAFSGGGAIATVQVTNPAKGAGIIPSAPTVVWPTLPDAQGLSWTATLSLRESAGVPALITGFTMDGAAQPLAQYFPSPQIPPSSTVRTTVTLRGITAPVSHTFGFTGTDATGQDWSRQVTVNYLPLPIYNFFEMAATPLTVTQDTSADPSCQWAAQINLSDIGGFLNLITNVYTGNGSISLASQIPAIFGTTRMDAWGGVQGTICFSGITPPATNYVEVDLTNGAQQIALNFAGPPQNPGRITPSPASVSLSTTGGAQSAQGTLAVNLSDKTQPWTASVFPNNRTTAWLSLSQRSGTGPGQITLTANAAGFAPGAYRAVIVLQSPNSIPQTVNVPVMFVLNASTSGTAINRIANPATDKPDASPGMLLTIYGTQLANTSMMATPAAPSFSLAGVTATVNGLPAPVLLVDPGQVNIQVPFEAGAGPAVLGINKNGEIAGFQFTLAPASPGIYADPNLSAKPGGYATVFVAGIGETTPALRTGFTAPSSTPVSALARPALPLSVTVGGAPAFLQFAGIPAGLIGVAQVNFLVPASVPAGPQPLVVTVGGVSSAPVTIDIQ